MRVFPSSSINCGLIKPKQQGETGDETPCCLHLVSFDTKASADNETMTILFTISPSARLGGRFLHHSLPTTFIASSSPCIVYADCWRP